MDYTRFSTENWTNFRDQLNYLVASCKFTIDKDITGKMAEYVAALMPHVVEGKINTSVNDLLSILPTKAIGTKTSGKVVSNMLVYGASVGSRVAKNGHTVYT